MRHEAILKLYPNVKSVSDAFGAFDKNHDLVEVDEDLVQKKITELQAEYDAQQYQRDRAVAYPSYADQLDTIYHQGIDAWKAEIKTIKDAHPKPT